MPHGGTNARGRDGGVRKKLAAGVTAPMSEHRDAIHFPQSAAIPSFAMAFMYSNASRMVRSVPPSLVGGAV
jgi:hypothetical protein